MRSSACRTRPSTEKYSVCVCSFKYLQCSIPHCRQSCATSLERYNIGYGQWSYGILLPAKSGGIPLSSYAFNAMTFASAKYFFTAISSCEVGCKEDELSVWNCRF